MKKVTEVDVERLARLSWDTGEDHYHASKGDERIPFSDLGEVGKEAVLKGTRAILNDLGVEITAE